ncbi:MAG: type IV secretory system conjugative DNA transfer family protein [Clostridia bacterium]|nr:type IV secretory system conjugative DNA transfer family protein [Clostridia bacterium]
MKKSKDVFRRWKTHSLKFKIITGILTALAFVVVPFFLLAVFVMLITSSSFGEVFHSGLFYGLFATAILGIVVFVLFEYRTLGSRRVKKVNKELEDSHFMSNQEIAKNEGFVVTKFSELENVNDGMLIIAERNQNDIDIVLCQAIHEMLIATTGTGKTTAYVSPFIEILSRTKEKPCMVITDPKGELYQRHASTLKKNGYNVHVIDMRDTYHSTLWNPFNDVMNKTDEIRADITQEKGRYYYCGRPYQTFSDAEQAKKERAVRVKDEVYIDLQDLIYTCCPVESAQDKSWQQGARDLLLGMALRMWEDYRDGYLPREKFNLYNLWWNLTEYARTDDECAVLKEYIDEIAEDGSRAKGMANTVLVSQDRTLASFLGSVNQYLHWMADGGIAQLTSGNNIEFSNWDEEPNVLFVVIADEKKNRHGLAVLLLVQLYKALVEKATRNYELHKTKDMKLLRNCYFLMDEFGNLPRFTNFETYIPISRGRGIFFAPVIQSLVQLDNVYGKEAAKIIRDNCNIRIFMGTTDEETRNVISESCGKHKTKQVSYNEEKGMSVSTSAQSVPLIYPSELSRLNDPPNGVIGNAVVTVEGNFPIRGKTTPYFKAIDIYGIEQLKEEQRNPFMEFKEQDNRYDITRLIYLCQTLNSDIETEEEQVEKIKQAVAEETIKDLAMINLQKQIIKEIEGLRRQLSEEDFLKLSMADTEGKIAILDELAEQATAVGDVFLVTKIEKVISLLKYSGVSIVDTGKTKEVVNYHD